MILPPSLDQRSQMILMALCVHHQKIVDDVMQMIVFTRQIVGNLYLVEQEGVYGVILTG